MHLLCAKASTAAVSGTKDTEVAFKHVNALVTSLLCAEVPRLQRALELINQEVWLLDSSGVFTEMLDERL